MQAPRDTSSTYTARIVGQKRKVYGNKAALKRSQGYPAPFGFEMARLFASHDETLKSAAADEDAEASSESDGSQSDDWSCCELDSMVSSCRDVWVKHGPGFSLR